MQLDGTIQLPDGERISVVLNVDPTQLEGVRSSSLVSADVIARAMEVLGSKEKALIWLRSKVPALADKRPLDIIDTAEGRLKVEDILGQIEHGIFG